MLLFGFPIRLRGITFTEDDYKLSRDMIHSWTTFAKTGVPPKLDKAEWVEAIDRKLANPSVRYMDLDPLNYTIVEGFYKKTCDEFWKTKFAGN
jgi:carboxylesterase type B